MKKSFVFCTLLVLIVGLCSFVNVIVSLTPSSSISQMPVFLLYSPLLVVCEIYFKPEMKVVPVMMKQSILFGSVYANGLTGLSGYEEGDGEAD